MTQILLPLALAAALALPAQAGSPVIIEDAYEAEPAPGLTPGEKIAIAAGLIVVGALIFGGGGGSSDCACTDQPEDGGGACTC
ncbi:MAG: hypothetical protein V4720_06350 [Pseudomonadota bacterium]